MADPEDADIADAPVVFTGAAPGRAMTADSGHFHASNMTFWLQPEVPIGARPGDCWINSDALETPGQPLDDKKVLVYDGVDWIDTGGTVDTSGLVSKTGDTMTGDLTIQKNQPLVDLRTTGSGQVAAYRMFDGNTLRFTVEMAGDGNFKVARFNSSGAFVDYPLIIGRDNPYVTVKHLTIDNAQGFLTVNTSDGSYAGVQFFDRQNLRWQVMQTGQSLVVRRVTSGGWADAITIDNPTGYITFGSQTSMVRFSTNADYTGLPAATSVPEGTIGVSIN